MSARLFALAIVVAASCAELPAIQAGTCGNGVIEAGEDCDGVAPNGAKCRGQNEESACHFDCSTASCPSGWSCSPNDGICREPSGTFATTSYEFETVAGRVLLGDVDGNRVQEIVTFSSPDVVGRTTPRVFYFDDVSRGPSKTLPVRAPAIAPVLRDVSGDGIQDFLFSSLDGLNVMIGADDRTLTPQAFSRFAFPKGSSTRMVRLHGLAPKVAVTGEAPVVFGSAMGRKFIGGVGGLEQSDLNDIAFLDKPPTEIQGEPLAANIVEDEKTSPCDELIWVWKGSDSVTFTPACTADGTWPAALVGRMTAAQKLFVLPDGDTIDEGVLATDLNVDGHIDLLIGGKTNDYVAFGRGDGTFSGDQKLAAGPSLAAYTCTVAGEPDTITPCEFPIAVTPPPRDRKATPTATIAVTAQAIGWVSPTIDKSGKLAIERLAVARKSAGSWSVARIADLNGNGALDVVAGSKDSLDLDFFNGTGTLLFNASKIATERPVRLLEVGDFDGDLVNDVALTETDADGAGNDRLSVAYGRFMSPPEPPFAIGEFPPVLQIISARIDDADLIDGLGLISGADGENIAVLLGGGERQLLSPYGFNFQIGPKNIAAAPVGVAVGKFDSDDKLDVAVAAFDAANADKGELPSVIRLWVAPSLGGGQLGPPQQGAEVSSISVFSIDNDGFDIISVLRAADLDGDGIDEAVLLAPTKGDKPRAHLLVAKAAPGKRGPELSPKFEADLAPTFAPAAGTNLELADVDGDGKLDAVILDVARRDRSVLLVAFGDGKGQFDVTGAVTVDVGKDDGAVRDFAIVPGGLALVSDRGVFLAKTGSRTLTPQKLAGFAGGTTIAAGDVSGDGLVDLVVGDGRRVQIHLGLARER